MHVRRNGRAGPDGQAETAARGDDVAASGTWATCGTCPEKEEGHNNADLRKLNEAAVGAFGRKEKSALAVEFALPASALDVLTIGWLATADSGFVVPGGQLGCWTFPEHGSEGQLVGLSLRYHYRDAGGRVIRKHFGKRGLTLPTGWQNMPDPVICVEGPSDVLAGRLIGLNAIGRPSNSGGADLLAETCRGRKLIILGENDRKSDGTWPGREGAFAVAGKLAVRWNRRPHVAYPPTNHKDLRDYIREAIKTRGSQVEG